MADKSKQDYPKLDKSLGVDVAIIGGGITGLISAYLLSLQGKKVIILEKNKVGSGATEYTTAFITQVIDTHYSDLLNMIGQNKAKLVANSHKKAIDLIESIIEKEKIECDFKRCSNFLYANSPQEAEKLSKELGAMKKLDIDANFIISKDKLGFDNFGCIETKNQAKFNASKFITALAKTLVKKGVVIFEGSLATSIESNGNIVSIKVAKHTVTSDVAIVATHEPFNKPLSLYFKKGFYTSYVLSAAIPKGTIKEGIYEDMENPYHYFRIDPDKEHDTITIGGEDHRSALKFSKKKIFSNLEKYLKSILPGVKYEITGKWSGPILEPVDGLPSIGHLGKENILYAMAFSGNGMTYAAIGAQYFTDFITKKNTDWANIYAANRIPALKSLLIKGKDYSEELIYGIRKSLA